jgi:hypothetical protein
MAASAVWQKVGIEKIPRCWQNFEQAGNVMRLWIDLWFPFTEAHTTPVDEELIGQIYDYASWCWTESRSYHSQTAVACAFYEHLPLEPKVREQIAKWISVDLFEGLKVYCTLLLRHTFFRRVGRQPSVARTLRAVGNPATSAAASGYTPPR